MSRLQRRPLENTQILNTGPFHFQETLMKNPRSRRDPASLEDAWAEATIAWSVCASIHREYAKGKDPFFRTRQGDFARHEKDARAALAKVHGND